MRELDQFQVVVFTSDSYLELLKGFSICFNRHWSEKQKVSVIGFKKPDFDLPPNFEFLSAGNQEDFEPYAFCKPFRPVIESLREEIIMFLDDCFLIRDVDLEVVDKAEDLVCRKYAQRVDMFWGGRSQYESTTEYDENFLEYPQNMDWRVSMSPCMIHRDHMLKYFNDRYNIWQAEKDAKNEAFNDGAVLLCGKVPVAPWINVVRNGGFNGKLILNRLPSGEFDWNPYFEVDEDDMETILRYKDWRVGETVECEQ
jgi:hypothetical protein